jgi:hypothetical protein
MAVCLSPSCGYEWTPRKGHPKKCPKCQNPHWDKPRTRRRVMESTHAERTVAAVENVDRLKQARERAEKMLERLNG